MISSARIIVQVLLCTATFYGVYSARSSYLDGVRLPKIAIVGGGVGGASAAAHLRDKLGSNLPSIDVYEGSSVGGRLQTVSIDGADYEVGGTIIHPDNQYMSKYLSKLGLIRLTDDRSFALFSGNEKVFEPSTNEYIMALQLFWRYGLSAFTLDRHTKKMLSDFSRIYKWQAEYQAFSTVPNLLMSMSEDIMNSTFSTLGSYLRQFGIAQLLIDELATAAAHTNYGQTVNNLHGFVGSVSLAGAVPGLYSIKGGNKQVPEKLLKASGVTVIKGVVTQIVNVSSDEKNQRYALYTSDGTSAEYDAVILSFPLISSRKDIDFLGFSYEFSQYFRPFHEEHVYIVKGTPNYKYFGYDDLDSMPSSIFNINVTDFFDSLGMIYSTKGDKPVYKVFANQKLDDQQLSNLFLTISAKQELTWLAYPEYQPNIEFVPFALAPRLYYTNAIELAASAMEMSAVGGVNVANLLVHQWLSNYHLIDNMFIIEEKHIKIEL